MKRVAFLSDSMERKGGSQRVACNLANEISKKMPVFFITWFKNEYQYETCKNIKKRFLCSVKKRARYSILALNLNLLKTVKDENIDIVLVVGRYAALATVLIAFVKKCSIIYCEHSSLSGYDRLYITPKTKLLSKVILLLYRFFSTHVVFLTKSDADKFTYDFGCSKKVTKHIYNWIEEKLLLNNLTYNDKSKKIISVGRIAKEKNYEVLVEVAKQVLTFHQDWCWDIYGDGEPEYKKYIKQLISENGLENKVSLKGNVDNLYELYSDYSFLVMTSKYEGLPMVLLEAKAKKLPLVSFDIETGPSEIIRNNIDGFLVAPFDTDEMSKKICRLIETPELRQKFSNNAYGNIDKFKKETIIAKWINLIEKVG